MGRADQTRLHRKFERMTVWRKVDKNTPKDRRLLVKQFGSRKVFAADFATNVLNQDTAWKIAALENGDCIIINATEWAEIPE